MQAPEDPAKLSIGALSRATGIPVETLRTWEQRYGFPVPDRKPSGHRVYPASIVVRLRRIAEAIARGHRAGEVVRSSEAQLAQLLDSVDLAPGPAMDSPGVAPALAAVRIFDGDRLTRLLQSEAGAPVVRFVQHMVAPLVRAVGDLWERGEIDVRHEHFLSERLGDVLRSLRMSLEPKAVGPPVLFATLTGEQHALGLQMAALVAVAAGCRVAYLGAEVPVEEIAAASRDLSAAAIALSVSTSASPSMTRVLLRKLVALAPGSQPIIVGGDGAEAVRGADERVMVLPSLPAFDRWVRRLGSPDDTGRERRS